MNIFQVPRGQSLCTRVPPPPPHISPASNFPLPPRIASSAQAVFKLLTVRPASDETRTRLCCSVAGRKPAVAEAEVPQPLTASYETLAASESRDDRRALRHCRRRRQGLTEGETCASRTNQILSPSPNKKAVLLSSTWGRQLEKINPFVMWSG